MTSFHESSLVKIFSCTKPVPFISPLSADRPPAALAVLKSDTALSIGAEKLYLSNDALQSASAQLSSFLYEDVPNKLAMEQVLVLPVFFHLVVSKHAKGSTSFLKDLTRQTWEFMKCHHARR